MDGSFFFMIFTRVLIAKYMNYRVLILFLVYMVFIVSLGYFRPRGKHSKYLIRKSVHLVTGLIIFYLSYHLTRQTLLLLIAAGTLFSFITFFIKNLNYIHVTGESSWGTLFYPVGILSSFLLLYNMPLHYFQITLLFLAVSDTVANMGGYLVSSNPRFRILSEKKTALGIAGFVLTSFLVGLLLLPGSGTEYIFFLVLTVVCATHFEIISHRGSDNLAIPLGTALFFLASHDKNINSLWLTGVILCMGFTSVILYKKGVLTRKGSIGAHVLGIYLFGICGWIWGVLVAFFFISSVALTRINNLSKRKGYHFGQRNIWQVMANILIAVVVSILYLISDQKVFIMFFISAVAAVTADTWASEAGPLFQRKCFSLSNMQTAPAGVSGGISMAGSMAAFVGSLSVSCIGWTLFFSGFDTKRVLILALSGLLASFVDSVLGAFLEPRLNKIDYFIRKKGTESPSPNDLVNFLASVSAPLFFVLLHFFFIGS
jgi:uncharacterized protein (TIGR00297 family)